MSNTQEVYLKGKCKWARTNTPDKYGKWGVVLYPDDASLETIRDLQTKGIKNVLKKDEDGYFMAFRREQQKNMRGKMVGFAAPIVLDKDGQLLAPDLMIGNGSDVTIKIEVYTYNVPAGGKGAATRLVSIRVDNLVPYEVNRDFAPDEQKAVEGLREQPAATF